MHFSDDTICRTLASKFTEISSANIVTLPRFPRVSITKSLQSIIFDVDNCLADVLSSSTPPLLHCVHLIHAAVATVMALRPEVESRSHGTRGSWRQRLETKIAILRRDLSQLVAGGYPPQGGRRLLYDFILNLTLCQKLHFQLPWRHLNSKSVACHSFEKI